MNSLPASYLILQFKRSAKFLPAVFAFGFVLFALIGALGFGLFSARKEEDAAALTRVELGVVADEEDPYQKLVLFTLQNADESRFSLHLVLLPDEESAREKLMDGTLDAAFLIPEHFSEKIASGVHLPIRYLTSPAATGLSAALTGEVARTFSRLVLEGENSVYGLQALVRERKPGETPSLHSNAMLEEDLAALVNRDLLFETEEIGIRDGQDFARTVRSCLTTFFLLIFGIGLTPFFSGKTAELKRMLAARGVGAIRQTAAEFFAYFLLYLTGCAVFLLPFLLLLHFFFPALFASLFPSGASVFSYLLSAAAGVFLFSSFHFALSSWTGGTVMKLLSATFLGIAMGFLSGCFYPASFLPAALQRIGAVLPTGAAIRLFARADLASLLFFAGYSLIFLFLALYRRLRLLGGKTE